MSTFLSVRRWERPDRPQPVYKGAVSLWEAPLYVSIGDSSRNSWRVADRQRDRTYVSQTVPSDAWRQFVVDRTVATWSPVFTAQPKYRAGSGRALDVRDYDWSPEPTGWIFAALPVTTTDAQRWPAIQQASGISYRSAERARLDVRRYEWAPEDGWRQPVVDAIVRSWIGVFDAEASSRTPAAPALDVRRYEWSPEPAWIFSSLPVTTSTAQQWPGVLEGLGLSYRSEARAPLDVRAYEWAPQPAWIFSALPAGASTAQQWPALLQNVGLSYRSPERARLDVRGYDWSPEDAWRRPVVDGIVAKWIPVFDAQVSYRSDDRSRLDARSVTWSPELAWLFPVLPVVVAPPVTATTEVTGTYEPTTAVTGTVE